MNGNQALARRNNNGGIVPYRQYFQQLPRVVYNTRVGVFVRTQVIIQPTLITHRQVVWAKVNVLGAGLGAAAILAGQFMNRPDKEVVIVWAQRVTGIAVMILAAVICQSKALFNFATFWAIITSLLVVAKHAWEGDGVIAYCAACNQSQKNSFMPSGMLQDIPFMFAMISLYFLVASLFSYLLRR